MMLGGATPILNRRSRPIVVSLAADMARQPPAVRLVDDIAECRPPLGADPLGSSELHTVDVVTMPMMRVFMVMVRRVVVAEYASLPARQALQNVVAVALRPHPPLTGSEPRGLTLRHVDLDAIGTDELASPGDEVRREGDC